MTLRLAFELADLDGVARLVVALAQVDELPVRPPDADRHGDLRQHLGDDGLQLAGELDDLLRVHLAGLDEDDDRVAARRADTEHVAPRHELVDGPVQPLLDVLRGGLGALRRVALGFVDVDEDDEVRRLRLEPEESEPAGDLLLVEVAGDELVEEVAGEALLGLGHGLLLDQLQRRHRDDVVQDDAVVLAEVAAVLDHGEERADAVRGDDRIDLYARTHALHAEGEVLAVGATVADHAPQVGDELGAEVAAVRRLTEHHAVEVEEYGRAADEGRERGEDGLEALLLQHDLGELLVDGQAALQQRVLFVDDLGRDGLGDGQERDVVGHLEQRKAVLLGHCDDRRRHLVETEAGAEPEAGDVVVDEALDLRHLLLLVTDETVAGGKQQLAALEPLGGIRDLGDVDPSHGVAGGLVTGQQTQVQLGDLEDVLDSDHRRDSTRCPSTRLRRRPSGPRRVCTFRHLVRREESRDRQRDPNEPRRAGRRFRGARPACHSVIARPRRRRSASATTAAATATTMTMMMIAVVDEDELLL